MAGIGRPPIHGLFAFKTATCLVCKKSFRHRKPKADCCSEPCRRERSIALTVNKKVVSVTEAAYLAGLVDGEGSISLWKENRPKTRRGWHLKAMISIANTSVPLLEWVLAVVENGSINTSDKRNNPRHKVVYKWFLYPNQMRWVLPQILPFLVLKKRQAEIVMRYFAVIDGSPLHDAAELEALYTECHALNQRGVVDPRQVVEEIVS